MQIFYYFDLLPPIIGVPFESTVASCGMYASFAFFCKPLLASLMITKEPKFYLREYATPRSASDIVYARLEHSFAVWVRKSMSTGQYGFRGYIRYPHGSFSGVAYSTQCSLAL